MGRKRRVLLKLKTRCRIGPLHISGLHKGCVTCPVSNSLVPFVSRRGSVHLSEVGYDVHGNFVRLYITSPKTKPTSEMLGVNIEFSHCSDAGYSR